MIYEHKHYNTFKGNNIPERCETVLNKFNL